MQSQDRAQGQTLWPADQETVSTTGTRSPLSVHSRPDPEVIAALLAENVGDYMSLGLFTHVLKASHLEPAVDLRRRCFEYLAHMINEEFILVGTVKGTAFIPWILGGAQLQEILASRWPAAGPTGYEDLRDIAWLANTPKGDAVALDYRAEWTTSTQSHPAPEAGTHTEPASTPPLIDARNVVSHRRAAKTRPGKGVHRQDKRWFPQTLRTAVKAAMPYVLGTILVLAAGLTIGLIVG